MTMSSAALILLPQLHSLWSEGHTAYVPRVPTPSMYPIATMKQNYILTSINPLVIHRSFHYRSTKSTDIF